MTVEYFSKLTNAQLDVYYSKHSAAIPLPFSGIKNKNYKVIDNCLHNYQAAQQEQPRVTPSGQTPKDISKSLDSPGGQ